MEVLRCIGQDPYQGAVLSNNKRGTEEARGARQHPNAHRQLLEESTIDDVWKPYKGYGEDYYLYSYLIAIEGEITNIMIMKYG